MSRRTIIIGVIVATVGLATLGIAWAVGPDDDADSRPAKLAQMVRARIARMVVLRDDLDITAEQRAELRGIFIAHRDDLRPAMLEVLEHKRALRDAVMAENPDEAAIRAEADALGDAIGDAAVAMSQVAGEARTVLTAEQLELIEEAMADNREAVDRFIEEAPAG